MSFKNGDLIAIKSIEYVVTSDDEVANVVASPNRFNPVSGDMMLDGGLVNTEVIRGRRFRRFSRDGQCEVDIMIGLSNEVADIFGFREEAFLALESEVENQSDFIQRLQRYNKDLAKANIDMAEEKLDLQSAGFWRRFIWLFVGVK